ncbi:hypothetical protein EYF80_004054 [Liparis tanakae]|uniref:Uncharacterized protein n=1 Tax=Liparis tanakae TaxID=230148 RepID=A0A4Z2J703_9TELE|nr:hypothetical protein EYF80_004054 [Liparis tanakae]
MDQPVREEVESSLIVTCSYFTQSAHLHPVSLRAGCWVGLPHVTGATAAEVCPVLGDQAVISNLVQYQNGLRLWMAEVAADTGGSWREYERAATRSNDRTFSNVEGSRDFLSWLGHVKTGKTINRSGYPPRGGR